MTSTWTWVSGNGVRHEVPGTRPCVTCGRAHRAYVAEYQRVRGGVLYRVVMPDGDPLGIVYVLRAPDGGLTAESFYGKPLPEVPPGARYAVTAYLEQARPVLEVGVDLSDPDTYLTEGDE